MSLAYRKLDPSQAWGCLVANLVLLPGLGSLFAGRLIEGIGQIILAAGGLYLTTAWFNWFVQEKLLRGQPITDLGPQFKRALAGFAFLGISWLWALVSSLLIMRSARSSVPPKI